MITMKDLERVRRLLYRDGEALPPHAPVHAAIDGPVNER